MVRVGVTLFKSRACAFAHIEREGCMPSWLLAGSSLGPISRFIVALFAPWSLLLINDCGESLSARDFAVQSQVYWCEHWFAMVRR